MVARVSWKMFVFNRAIKRNGSGVLSDSLEQISIGTKMNLLGAEFGSGRGEAAQTSGYPLPPPDLDALSEYLLEVRVSRGRPWVGDRILLDKVAAELEGELEGDRPLPQLSKKRVGFGGELDVHRMTFQIRSVAL